MPTPTNPDTFLPTHPLTGSEREWTMAGAIFDTRGTCEVSRVGAYLVLRLHVRTQVQAHRDLLQALCGGTVTDTAWMCSGYEAGIQVATALLPYVSVQRHALTIWRDLRALVKKDGPLKLGDGDRAEREALVTRLRAARACRWIVTLEELRAWREAPVPPITGGGATLYRGYLARRAGAAAGASTVPTHTVEG